MSWNSRSHRRNITDVVKGALLGAGVGGGGAALVGSLYGRAIITAGLAATGIGLPAAVGLGTVGAIAGAVAGAAATAASKKSRRW